MKPAPGVFKRILDVLIIAVVVIILVALFIFFLDKYPEQTIKYTMITVFTISIGGMAIRYIWKGDVS